MTGVFIKRGALNTETNSHRRKTWRRETEGEDSHLKAKERDMEQFSLTDLRKN